jgi:hypothetical protein
MIFYSGSGVYGEYLGGTAAEDEKMGGKSDIEGKNLGVTVADSLSCALWSLQTSRVARTYSACGSTT